MNPFDNTVLSPSTRSEDTPVEEIVSELSYDQGNELLKDLEGVMLLPEMEPFLTYLAVRNGVHHEP